MRIGLIRIRKHQSIHKEYIQIQDYITTGYTKMAVVNNRLQLGVRKPHRLAVPQPTIPRTNLLGFATLYYIIKYREYTSTEQMTNSTRCQTKIEMTLTHRYIFATESAYNVELAQVLVSY